MKTFCSYCLLMLFGLVPLSSAATTQTYGYFDATFINTGETVGTYTSDANWTQEQMDCAERALNTWMEILGYAEPSRNIRVLFRFRDDGATLAAGSSLWGNEIQIGEYDLHNTAAEALWIDGFVDVLSALPNRYDALITLSSSSAVPMYFGANPAGIQSHQYDAESLILHEMGHVLSFNSQSEAWDRNNFTRFDLTMRDADGNMIDKNNAEYSGSATFTAGEDGTPVYNTGSSRMTHLGTLGGTNPWVMSPSSVTGRTKRNLTDAEIKLMGEMGWQTGPTSPIVPEPTTATMGLLGLAGLLLRRRRRHFC